MARSRGRRVHARNRARRRSDRVNSRVLLRALEAAAHDQAVDAIVEVGHRLLILGVLGVARHDVDRWSGGGRDLRLNSRLARESWGVIPVAIAAPPNSWIDTCIHDVYIVHPAVYSIYRAGTDLADQKITRLGLDPSERPSLSDQGSREWIAQSRQSQVEVENFGWSVHGALSQFSLLGL